MHLRNLRNTAIIHRETNKLRYLPKQNCKKREAILNKAIQVVYPTIFYTTPPPQILLTTTVAQLEECSLSKWKVVGSNPGWV